MVNYHVIVSGITLLGLLFLAIYTLSKKDKNGKQPKPPTPPPKPPTPPPKPPTPPPPPKPPTPPPITGKLTPTLIANGGLHGRIVRIYIPDDEKITLPTQIDSYTPRTYGMSLSKTNKYKGVLFNWVAWESSSIAEFRIGWSPTGKAYNLFPKENFALNFRSPYSTYIDRLVSSTSGVGQTALISFLNINIFDQKSFSAYMEAWPHSNNELYIALKSTTKTDDKTFIWTNDSPKSQPLIFELE